MAHIVVVGGGFAGLSIAARLAKLRHDVEIFEANSQLGGRLRHREIDGNAFAIAPETVTLPGVLRDLFRKSGRPLERVAELSAAGPRLHVARTGKRLDLPFGNRADQHDAVLAALDEDQWSPWVDQWPDAWNLMRQRWLDRDDSAGANLSSSRLDRADKQTLFARWSLSRMIAKQLKAPALANIVLDPLRLEGQDRRRAPAILGVRHYVERNFGLWRFVGGLPVLADALVTRLDERKVVVHLNTPITDVRMSGVGAVTGVRTNDSVVDADIVIWCAPPPRAAADPYQLFGPSRLIPAIPATRTFIRVAEADIAELIGEHRDLYVHSKPAVRLLRGDDGNLTLLHSAVDDPLRNLAVAKIDLRRKVIGEPTTLSPPDLVRIGHWGWQWGGLSSLDDWPGARQRDDFYLAGAAAWPSGILGGGSVEEIGMGTAAIAAAIGAASR